MSGTILDHSDICFIQEIRRSLTFKDNFNLSKKDSISVKLKKKVTFNVRVFPYDYC